MKTWKKIIILAIATGVCVQGTIAAVNGLVFRLQIEIRQRPNLDNYIQFQPMEGMIAQGEKILAGSYTEYLQAMKAKYNFAKISPDPAGIVAFYRQQSITLDQAFTLLNDENATDEVVINRPDTARSREVVNQVQSRIQFKFEIYTSADHTLEMLFEKHPEWRTSIVQLEEGRYLVGAYEKYSEAVAMQNQLDSEGFRKNIIVAFQNEKKIPVFIALSTKTITSEEVAQDK